MEYEGEPPVWKLTLDCVAISRLGDGKVCFVTVELEGESQLDFVHTYTINCKAVWTNVFMNYENDVLNKIKFYKGEDEYEY